MVRAKFYVTSVEPNGAEKEEDQGSTVSLSPVMTGSEENENFYKWTPGGNIVLSTINKAAADQFKVGMEFYVDFTPAEGK